MPREVMASLVMAPSRLTHPFPLSVQTLKPEYAKAATAIKEYDASIVIAKVLSPPAWLTPAASRS